MSNVTFTTLQIDNNFAANPITADLEVNHFSPTFSNTGITVDFQASNINWTGAIRTSNVVNTNDIIGNTPQVTVQGNSTQYGLTQVSLEGITFDSNTVNAFSLITISGNTDQAGNVFVNPYANFTVTGNTGPAFTNAIQSIGNFQVSGNTSSGGNSTTGKFIVWMNNANIAYSNAGVNNYITLNVNLPSYDIMPAVTLTANVLTFVSPVAGNTIADELANMANISITQLTGNVVNYANVPPEAFDYFYLYGNSGVTAFNPFLQSGEQPNPYTTKFNNDKTWLMSFKTPVNYSGNNLLSLTRINSNTATNYVALENRSSLATPNLTNGGNSFAWSPYANNEFYLLYATNSSPREVRLLNYSIDDTSNANSAITLLSNVKIGNNISSRGIPIRLSVDDLFVSHPQGNIPSGNCMVYFTVTLGNIGTQFGDGNVVSTQFRRNSNLTLSNVTTVFKRQVTTNQYFYFEGSPGVATSFPPTFNPENVTYDSRYTTGGVLQTRALSTKLLYNVNANVVLRTEMYRSANLGAHSLWSNLTSDTSVPANRYASYAAYPNAYSYNYFASDSNAFVVMPAVMSYIGGSPTYSKEYAGNICTFSGDAQNGITKVNDMSGDTVYGPTVDCRNDLNNFIGYAPVVSGNLLQIVGRTLGAPGPGSYIAYASRSNLTANWWSGNSSQQDGNITAIKLTSIEGNLLTSTYPTRYAYGGINFGNGISDLIFDNQPQGATYGRTYVPPKQLFPVSKITLDTNITTGTLTLPTVSFANNTPGATGFSNFIFGRQVVQPTQDPTRTRDILTLSSNIGASNFNLPFAYDSNRIAGYIGNILNYSGYDLTYVSGNTFRATRNTAGFTNQADFVAGNIFYGNLVPGSANIANIGRYPGENPQPNPEPQLSITIDGNTFSGNLPFASNLAAYAQWSNIITIANWSVNNSTGSFQVSSNAYQIIGNITGNISNGNSANITRSYFNNGNDTVPDFTYPYVTFTFGNTYGYNPNPWQIQLPFGANANQVASLIRSQSLIGATITGTGPNVNLTATTGGEQTEPNIALTGNSLGNLSFNNIFFAGGGNSDTITIANLTYPLPQNANPSQTIVHLLGNYYSNDYRLIRTGANVFALLNLQSGNYQQPQVTTTSNTQTITNITFAPGSNAVFALQDQTIDLGRVPTPISNIILLS